MTGTAAGSAGSCVLPSGALAPPSAPPRVAVVVLTFEAERFVDACFGALRRADRSCCELSVLAVDNGSRDGTVQRIRQGFPEVELVENGANLGYAGGNDVGMRRALDRGADFVYLLNPDTEAEPGFLAEALAVAQRHPEAGSVQSLLLLADERDRVNTWGNASHFLGFGYCGGYRQPAAAAPAEPREIAFASGAAALYRGEALRQVGLLDEALFLYQEDHDLGWRLRLAGWRNLLAPRSVVFHAYAVSRNPRKHYFLERNRHWLLLKNVSGRNLLLLAPLLAAAELGLLVLAAVGGWLPEKLRADRDAFRPSALRRLRAERRRVAALRAVPDREIYRLVTGTVDFEGAAPGPIQRLANRLLAAVWRLLRPLLR
jgi:GT2 family glycosyltransferase